MRKYHIEFLDGIKGVTITCTYMEIVGEIAKFVTNDGSLKASHNVVQTAVHLRNVRIITLKT